MDKKIKILIISGGALKGSCYLGMIDELISRGLNLSEIEVFAGSSIGGLLSFCLCVGYKIEEIKKMLFDLNMKKIFPFCFGEKKIVLDILENDFSLNDSKEMDYQIQNLFINKNLSFSHLTFQKLYDITQKELVISGSNITTGNSEYFSHVNTPQMIVYHALQITSRIPYLLPKFILNSNYYVDGDILDSFPISGISRKYKKDIRHKNFIGLIVKKPEKSILIHNIADYTKRIPDVMISKFINIITKKYKKNIIQCSVDHNIGIFFNHHDLNDLYNKGKIASQLFIDNPKNAHFHFPSTSK